MNLDRTYFTLINRYLRPAEGDADEYIRCHIIEKGIAIDTSNPNDLLPRPLRLIDGQYDRLRVVPPSISIDDHVGTVGERKLAAWNLLSDLHELLCLFKCSYHIKPSYKMDSGKVTYAI